MKRLTYMQLAKIDGLKRVLGSKNFYRALAIRKVEIGVNKNLGEFGEDFTIALSDFWKKFAGEFPDFAEAVDTFIDYTENKSSYILVNDLKNSEEVIAMSKNNEENVSIAEDARVVPGVDEGSVEEVAAPLPEGSPAETVAERRAEAGHPVAEEGSEEAEALDKNARLDAEDAEEEESLEDAE